MKQLYRSVLVSAVYLTVDRPKVWNWIGDAIFLNQLGWVQNPTNGDLLPQWGLSSIGPSVYGMDVENHDVQSVPSIANYRLDFVAQPTPEPSIVCLTLAGAALMWLRSRTRKVP